MRISFNKPYLTGNETEYIKDAILNKRKVSGNGYYTNLCQLFFEEKYNIKKALLTTSCTDALEMASILINIKNLLPSEIKEIDLINRSSNDFNRFGYSFISPRLGES